MAKPSVPGTNTHRPRLESTRAGPGVSALHPASPLPLPGGREKKSAASPATSASLGGGTPVESHPAWASHLSYPPIPSQALQSSFAKGTN